MENHYQLLVSVKLHILSSQVEHQLFRLRFAVTEIPEPRSPPLVCLSEPIKVGCSSRCVRSDLTQFRLSPSLIQ